MSANRLNSQEVVGRFISTTQGMLVGSTEVMPVAEEKEYGVVIQYLGSTNDSLIRNHLYRCTSEGGVFSWTDVTPIVDIVYDENVVMGTDANGLLMATEVTVDELDMLKGIEGNVQEQITDNYDTLDSKIDSREAYLQGQIDEKVDKYTDPEGNVYQLSQADFTIREKNKLSSVSYGAQVNNIEEIQVNNVTVQPQSKIVNLSILEGHTYPIAQLVAGMTFEVKHDLIRTVYFAQVRDSQGNVISGDMKINDTVVDITPDVNATDCTLFVICGGI